MTVTFANKTKQILLFVSYEVRQFPFLDTSKKAAKIFIFYLTKGLEYFRYQSKMIYSCYCFCRQTVFHIKM